MSESASHPAPTEDELALLKAAYASDLELVQSLVAKGANVNVQSNEFYDMGAHRDVTPLMCAADRRHLAIVRWLLEHGANHAAETVLTKSEGGPGTQALHFAAGGGHEAVIAALLDAGANPNAQGRYGRTPLSSALGEGKLACAKLLLSRGASASVKSKHKEFKPPLVVLTSAASNTTSMVSRNGKLVPAAKDLWDQKELLLELMKSLLAAGADPNATASSRDVPLQFVARRLPDDISIPLARILLEGGADADATDKLGYSPLLMAAVCNSTSFARLLLEHAVDVNRLCPRGSVLDVVESNLETAKRDIASARTDAIRGQFEAERRDLESFRDLIISRGGKRKSELPAAPAKAPKPEKRHIASDFLKLINSTDYSVWALLAVKAPFETVTDAYFKYAKSKSREQNVPVRPAGGSGEEIAPLTAVVKIKDSPWTFILRTIFYPRMPDMKHATAAAKKLSESLSTRAVAWWGTEETTNGRCELFENGERTATASSAKTIALLTTEKVPLPACYPARNGDKTWLAVEAPSISMVERADLIAR